MSGGKKCRGVAEAWERRQNLYSTTLTSHSVSIAQPSGLLAVSATRVA